MRNLFLHFVAALVFLASFAGNPAKSAPVCKRNSAIGEQLQLPVYEWVDEKVPRKGTIVALHSYLLHGAMYDQLARHLASKGYAVYAPDMRGFGRWKTEYQKFGGDDQTHFTQTKEDVLRLSTLLRLRNPHIPLICLGESLGANYALWMLSNNDQLFDGAILCAPGMKAYLHPGPRMAMDLAKGIIHPNKRLDLQNYITPYISHNKCVAEACLADKNISMDLSLVDLLRTQNVKRSTLKNVGKISATTPLLVIAGHSDKVLKTSALPALVKKMGSQNITVHTMPARGHLLLEAQKVDPDLQYEIDKWLWANQPRPTAANTVRALAGKVTPSGVQTDNF